MMHGVHTGPIPAGFWAVRCSPNCPYEDCVILTNVPPMVGQGGSDGNSTNNNTDNSANGDASRGDSGQQSGQAEPGNNNQSNQSDSGTGRTTTNDIQNQPGTGRSDAPKQDQKQQNSAGSEDDARQKKGEGRREPKVQPKSDRNEGNGNQTEKTEPEQPKNQQPKEQEHPQDRPQQRIAPAPKINQEAVYYPVFGDGNGPEQKGGEKGGYGNVGIADLGKHQNRKVVVTDQVFYAKLKNVMKDNAYDRPVRGRKRGKLDMRSLYKVPMRAENVFTLKEARKNKHYNVTMLVDQSGSMYDGKIEVAADVAAFLARSLEKVGINYSVMGYSDKWRYHKKFSDAATDTTLGRMKYDIMHTGGGGTRLMPVMKAAYKELKKTPDYQSIVVCINDGGPAESSEEIRQYVRGNSHTAEYIEIGINSPTVMTDGITVAGVSQLKPLLIKELKRRIKRG